MPVAVLFENLVGGMSLDEIPGSYPTLERAQAIEALRQAEFLLEQPSIAGAQMRFGAAAVLGQGRARAKGGDGPRRRFRRVDQTAPASHPARTAPHDSCLSSVRGLMVCCAVMAESGRLRTPHRVQALAAEQVMRWGEGVTKG